MTRIYPLHLVTFLLMAFLVAIGAVHALSTKADANSTTLGFVANLFMLQALPGVTAWNFPSWSLTCEFAAYLLFPLAAARLLRVRWRTALVIAVIALCLQMTIMFQFGPDDLVSPNLGWPRVAGEFVAGAMAWVVWRQVSRPGRWGDVVVVLCTVGAWSLLLNGYSWLWTIPLFAVMIPAIASATGPVARFLAHPLVQWGGRLSFAVYLIHIPVVTAAMAWVIPADMYVHHSGRAAALALSGIFVTSWVLAAMLHHGVEEPVRRWLRRRYVARSNRRTAKPVLLDQPVAS